MMEVTIKLKHEEVLPYSVTYTYSGVDKVRVTDRELLLILDSVRLEYDKFPLEAILSIEVEPEDE